MNDIFNQIVPMILKNIGTFSITIFGVEMTIFTVVYSFIVSKKNYLKEINRNISISGQTPFFASERKFAYSYIAYLRKLNIHIITLASISLMLFIASLFGLRDTSFNIYDWVLCAISLIYLIYSIVMFIIYIVTYFKEVKD